MSYKSKKCPDCGKVIPSYGKECFACGHKFRSSCMSARCSSKSYSSRSLTLAQRSVKALGSTITCNTGSKHDAKEILINQYGFTESTAKYAVGYHD